TNLALIDLNTLDETVLIGNIVRVVENLCHEELITLNRGIGHLMQRNDLETAANPLAPATIMSAFGDALGELKAENRVKFQILKEMNQAPLGDIAAIYSDVNRHLANLRIVPPGSVRTPAQRAAPAQRKRAVEDKHPEASQQPAPEMDMMAMFRRMASHGGFPLT